MSFNAIQSSEYSAQTNFEAEKLEEGVGHIFHIISIENTPDLVSKLTPKTVADINRVLKTRYEVNNDNEQNVEITKVEADKSDCQTLNIEFRAAVCMNIRAFIIEQIEEVLKEEKE